MNAFLLANLWIMGALVGLLGLIAAGGQLAGIMPTTNTRQVTLTLAGGSLAFCACATAVAWGMRRRQLWALYCSIALVVCIGVALIAGGMLVRGYAGAALATIGVIMPALLVLAHLAAVREFRGELRRALIPSRARSAVEFYAEGRELRRTGLRYAAAQRWARAIGKAPGTVEYIHALALVLAELGHHERALGQIDLALRLAPNDQQLRESQILIERKR